MKKLSKYLAATFLVLMLILSVAACPDSGKTTHTHDWGEWETVTEPTCTEDGTKTRVCLKNSSHIENDIIPALGHDWSEWQTITASTCTENGAKTRVCLRDSSHIENDIIPINSTAHEWGEWQTTTEPTCTGSGIKTRVCLHNSLHIENGFIPATGHDWSEWQTVTEPTCTQDGTKTRVCCSHDSSHIENGTIPAIGHDWSEWQTTIEPTETKDGEQVQVCSHCGEVKTMPITAGLEYILINDDTEYEGKAGTATSSNVYLPAYHSGLPVTSVGNSAFSACISLTSIFIPDGVTSIGEYAFCLCTSLMSIVIPDSVTSIDYRAFDYCLQLTTIFYGGANSTEWYLINIHSDNDTSLTNAFRYYYSETKPATSGRYWHWVNDKPTIWT